MMATPVCAMQAVPPSSMVEPETAQQVLDGLNSTKNAINASKNYVKAAGMMASSVGGDLAKVAEAAPGLPAGAPNLNFVEGTADSLNQAGRALKKGAKVAGVVGSSIGAMQAQSNLAAAYRDGDAPVMVKETGALVSNAGSIVGSVVPGVGGATTVFDAGARATSAAMRGDYLSSAAATGEALAYGSVCSAAATVSIAAGPAAAAEGCDKAVWATKLGVEVTNSALGAAIDAGFRVHDAIVDYGDDFATMRNKAKVSAAHHTEIRAADDQRAAAFAEQLRAGRQAAYDKAQNERSTQDLLNTLTALQAAQNQSRGEPVTGNSVGGCHPGHDERAHPGGCHAG